MIGNVFLQAVRFDVVYNKLALENMKDLEKTFFHKGQNKLLHYDLPGLMQPLNITVLFSSKSMGVDTKFSMPDTFLLSPPVCIYRMLSYECIMLA